MCCKMPFKILHKNCSKTWLRFRGDSTCIFPRIGWPFIELSFVYSSIMMNKYMHTVKKRLAIFTSTTESLVIDIPAGDRKIATLFLQCSKTNTALYNVK